MYFCPGCHAEVSAKVTFCGKCGYNLTNAGLMAPQTLATPPSQPHNTSTLPSIPIPPTRIIKPATKHNLTQAALTSEFDQPNQPGTVERAPLAQEKQTRTRANPSSSVGLIRPVGMHFQQTETFKNFDEHDESFVATSKAAEHWRTSWRNRQRSEAGPATSVSRGQASVAEPLLAMQDSLTRIRAIIVARHNAEAQKTGTGFWIALSLMLCLMGGLIAYIVSTYLPTTASAVPITAPMSRNIPPPSLSFQGPQLAAITQGQILHLHGENFKAGVPIIFSLDGGAPINGTNGREMSVLTSDRGAFDVAIPTTTWSPGERVVQAMDNKSGQSAYFTIQVNLTHPTANAELALAGANPLLFRVVSGTGNPADQYVTLINKNSTTELAWTAQATTDGNLSWLDIDPATAGGILQIGGTNVLRVGVNSAGLKSKATPYMGEIVFTINQTEQLTLPVELQIQDEAAELVINPNALIAC
ncbi:MAG: hypothetical protein ACJ788_14400 [Ktedonobacteraceae bacterium]